MSSKIQPNHIPIIDISPFISNDNTDENKKTISHEIAHACSQYGFFYIKNHGVSSKLTNDMLKCSEELFNLEKSKKKETEAKLNPLFRGYICDESNFDTCGEAGNDGFAKKEIKESFTIGAETTENVDSPMHGPNSWPNTQYLSEGWKFRVLQYWAVMHEVSAAVSRGLALSLNLDEEYFKGAMTNPGAQMVMLKYPPLEGSEVGCGAHTDCGFLTILLQSETEGLEVKLLDGTWTSAPPIPGTFVVNLGDMAQRWSNDRYKSTEHRAFNHPTKLRYSVPFFCNCNYETMVDCIVEEEGSKKYKSIKAGDYIMQKLGLMGDRADVDFS